MAFGLCSVQGERRERAEDNSLLCLWERLCVQEVERVCGMGIIMIILNREEWQHGLV